MRIWAHDLQNLKPHLPAFDAPQWRQSGHREIWPFAPHGKAIAKSVQFHTVDFGHFYNVKTGEKIYLSSCVAKALESAVRAAWPERLAKDAARRATLPPFGYWRKAHKDKNHMHSLSKFWFSFFPTVCELWSSTTSTATAAGHISRFWSKAEIRQCADVLQCKAEPHFLAKTILRAKSSDEFVPF